MAFSGQASSQGQKNSASILHERNRAQSLGQWKTGFSPLIFMALQGQACAQSPHPVQRLASTWGNTLRLSFIGFLLKLPSGEI